MELNGQPISAEIVTEAHVVEQNGNHLNGREQALLIELLRPGVKIESVIPDNADPKELWATLDACSRGMGLLDARTLRVRYIVGHILLLFEAKPSLYKSLGHKSYHDFMHTGVYTTLGISATVAYEAKKAAEFKQLTPDRYAKIGPKKMNILTKAAITPSNPNVENWLKTAESMKVPELKTFMEQRGHLNKGESDKACLAINTNQDRMALFRAFFNDGRVQSVCGSKEWDVILQSAIQEVYDEWIAKYDQQREEEFKKKYETTDATSA